MKKYFYLPSTEQINKNVDFLLTFHREPCRFSGVILGSCFGLNHYQIDGILTDDFIPCQVALASLVNQNFSHKHVETLINHPNFHVRSALVSNLSIPLTHEQINKCLHDEEWIVRALLVNREDVELTEEQLSICLFDDFYPVRLAAAKKPEAVKLSYDIAAAVLHKDVNPLVSTALVNNILKKGNSHYPIYINKTEERRREQEDLFSSDIDEVAASVAINSVFKLSNEQIDRALRHPSSLVNMCIATRGNISFTKKQIDFALESNDDKFVYTIVNNPTAKFTPEQVEMAMNHHDPSIREAADRRRIGALTQKQIEQPSIDFEFLSGDTGSPHSQNKINRKDSTHRT